MPINGSLATKWIKTYIHIHWLMKMFIHVMLFSWAKKKGFLQSSGVVLSKKPQLDHLFFGQYSRDVRQGMIYLLICKSAQARKAVHIVEHCRIIQTYIESTRHRPLHYTNAASNVKHEAKISDLASFYSTCGFLPCIFLQEKGSRTWHGTCPLICPNNWLAWDEK